jgi:hypothetical protein
MAYTIVLSQGLIDVLPDEASRAMILAHELAHIAVVLLRLSPLSPLQDEPFAISTDTTQKAPP